MSSCKFQLRGSSKLTDETEKVIDLVRECRFLHVKDHPDYKDVLKKFELWQDIAEKLKKKQAVSCIIIFYSQY